MEPVRPSTALISTPRSPFFLSDGLEAVPDRYAAIGARAAASSPTTARPRHRAAAAFAATLAPSTRHSQSGRARVPLALDRALTYVACLSAVSDGRFEVAETFPGNHGSYAMAVSATATTTGRPTSISDVVAANIHGLSLAHDVNPPGHLTESSRRLSYMQAVIDSFIGPPNPLRARGPASGTPPRLISCERCCQALMYVHELTRV